MQFVKTANFLDLRTNSGHNWLGQNWPGSGYEDAGFRNEGHWIWSDRFKAGMILLFDLRITRVANQFSHHNLSLKFTHFRNFEYFNYMPLYWYFFSTHFTRLPRKLAQNISFTTQQTFSYIIHHSLLVFMGHSVFPSLEDFNWKLLPMERVVHNFSKQLRKISSCWVWMRSGLRPITSQCMCRWSNRPRISSTRKASAHNGKASMLMIGV